MKKFFLLIFKPSWFMITLILVAYITHTNFKFKGITMILLCLGIGIIRAIIESLIDLYKSRHRKMKNIDLIS